MQRDRIHKILTFFTATVWLINGLICKVLDYVPRHELIVAEITGSAYSRPLTLLIGLSEMIMAAWILSGHKSKINAFAQIGAVALMNTLEFILVPQLLLWGRLNAVFALLFILLVYINEFYFNQKRSH